MEKISEKELFKENKKRKEGLFGFFFTARVTAVKKNSTMIIRKHTNKLKVNEKTVRTAIKQNLIPDINHLDYSPKGVLETKQMQLSIQKFVHLRLLGRRNEMSEEFIMKVCKLFRIGVDTIIKKDGGHIEQIYCFLTILFCCLFFFN